MRKLSCLLIPLLLTGCITPEPSPSAQFFQLQPDADLQPSGKMAQNKTVLVGPVEVSPYLDRPQFVQRRSPHEVVYREFARWAEPLERNISAVIAANLRKLTGSQRVIEFTPMTPGQGDYTVRIHVDRFEAELGGKALLRVIWAVMGTGNKSDTKIHHTQYKETVVGETYEDAVAVQSRLLRAFSKEIATELLAMQGK